MYKFKTNNFDNVKLGNLVAELQRTGLDLEIKWQDGNKVSLPGQANGLIVFLGEQQLFKQVRHMAALDIDNQSEQTQAAFYSALSRHEVLKQPDYALGIVCLIGYALLQLLVMSRVVGMGPAWVAGVLASYALLVAGHAGFVARNNPQNSFPFWLAIGMMAPALLFTAPSSLLNMPLLTQYNRSRVYNRAQQFLGQPVSA